MILIVLFNSHFNFNQYSIWFNKNPQYQRKLKPTSIEWVLNKLLWNETDFSFNLMIKSLNMLLEQHEYQHVIGNAIKMAEIIIENLLGIFDDRKMKWKKFAIKMSCSINCYNQLYRVASGVYLLGFFLIMFEMK